MHWCIIILKQKCLLSDGRELIFAYFETDALRKKLWYNQLTWSENPPFVLERFNTHTLHCGDSHVIGCSLQRSKSAETASSLSSRSLPRRCYTTKDVHTYLRELHLPEVMSKKKCCLYALCYIIVKIGSKHSLV